MKSTFKSQDRFCFSSYDSYFLRLLYHLFISADGSRWKVWFIQSGTGKRITSAWFTVKTPE